MSAALFPDAARVLFEPHRYKVLKGGRGSAKSHSVAGALVVLGARQKLRIFCGRETQKSIADSVHKLLSDKIHAANLGEFYLIEKATIKGKNGTEFIFAGLKHNIANIKSLENVDIAWIEEAQSVSKTSWETLIPTIRKEGSEIWITFNPDTEKDETYQRFVIEPSPQAVVVTMNWRDNPWFPETLDRERRELKAKDPDAYLNVWEGHPRQMLDGAVYKSELRKVIEENRITKVPYDASRPVHTFWDLGFRDSTAIWFAQSFPFEYRIIDYYQNCQEGIAHYQKVLQDRGYIYGTHWLPHDGRAHEMGTGRSTEEILRDSGMRVQIVPQLSVADGLAAGRSILGACWFDEAKCEDGITALKRYRFDRDADRNILGKLPRHDEYSHGADAFRYLAIAIRPPKPEQKPRVTTEGFYAGNSDGWMG